MQVKYTTASILLLTSALAAPDDLGSIGSMVNGDVSSALKVGQSVANGAATAAEAYASIAVQDAHSIEAAAISLASYRWNDAASHAVAEAQSLATEADLRISVAQTAAGAIATSLSSDVVVILNSADYIVSSIVHEFNIQITTLTDSAGDATATVTSLLTATNPASNGTNPTLSGTNSASNATNLATSSSSTAGAAMPTSGLGIGLAGLAGIVGVIAIAL